MKRKGSFTIIPVYYRKFKLQPSKNKGSYNFGILLFLIMAIVVGFAIPNWLTKARIQHKEIIELKVKQDNQAFSFLLNSGKKRLQSGNVKGAYSEFKLAVVIKPDHTDVNQLLFETISLLFEESEEYCKELDNLKL